MEKGNLNRAAGQIKGVPWKLDATAKKSSNRRVDHPSDKEDPNLDTPIETGLKAKFSSGANPKAIPGTQLISVRADPPSRIKANQNQDHNPGDKYLKNCTIINKGAIRRNSSPNMEKGLFKTKEGQPQINSATDWNVPKERVYNYMH